MKARFKDLLSGATITVLLCWFNHAVAQDAVATVSNLRGFVTAEAASGDKRTLKKGDELRAGETVVTTRRANAKLVFNDQSIISLRQKTTFTINKFEYAENGTDAEAEFLIAEGALEAISGLIGKLFPKSYRMNTPISTIGVRGTTYQVEVFRPQNGRPVEVRVKTLDGAIVYSSLNSSGKNTPIPRSLEANGDISEVTVDVDDSTGVIESIVLESGNSLSQSDVSAIQTAIGLTPPPAPGNNNGNNDNAPPEPPGPPTPPAGSAI